MSAEKPFAERIVRLKDAHTKLGCSPSTVRNWIAKGILPRPVVFTNSFRYWLKEDFDRVIADRIAESRKK